MMKKTFCFNIIFVVQIVSFQPAIAEPPAISPNQIVEKSFLVYQIGSNVPYSGLVVSIRYDGSKAYEERYVDGRSHGARTEWDQLGNKVSEITYENGAKTGPETYWYSSGQVMAITYFANGGRHGPATRWCKTGQKRIEWLYANNMKNGVQKMWYVNGQIATQDIWADDRPSGRMTRWYENGQMKSDVNADADRKIVTSTKWYEDGQKQCEAIIAKGEPPTRTAWGKKGNVLELDYEELLTHCNSGADAWPGTEFRPGETIVSVRGSLDRLTRYSTIGNETTEEEIEVSAAQREKMISDAKSVRECGLPRAMAPGSGHSMRRIPMPTTASGRKQPFD